MKRTIHIEMDCPIDVDPHDKRLCGKKCQYLNGFRCNAPFSKSARPVGEQELRSVDYCRNRFFRLPACLRADTKQVQRTRPARRRSKRR